jgi:S-adenosylmethionine synthetase
VRERGNTMYEKVNPCHPDKVADRIAGALVDLAYAKKKNPRIAVEVLIGHGVCHIIAETSVRLNRWQMSAAVHRIAGNVSPWTTVEVPQDGHLAENQKDGIRCGDNGIFKGMPVTEEQKTLSRNRTRIFSASIPLTASTSLTANGSSSARAMPSRALRKMYPGCGDQSAR